MSDEEFFQPPSPRAHEFEEPPAPEWFGPPDLALPSVVPLEVTLFADEKTVLFVSAAEVFAKGFVLRLFALAADGDADIDPMGFALRTSDASPQLRFGLRFSDGRKATNIGGDDFACDLGSRPESPVLMASGGRGGGQSWEQGYWVWPLPPKGQLELVCEWPSREIPLTISEIDSEPIRVAAARSREPFGS